MATERSCFLLQTTFNNLNCFSVQSNKRVAILEHILPFGLAMILSCIVCKGDATRANCGQRYVTLHEMTLSKRNVALKVALCTTLRP